MGVSAAVVGSAVVAGAASKSAAKSQSSSADKAAEASQEAAAQARQDLTEYRNLGSHAINPLIRAMGLNLVDGVITENPNSFMQQQFNFNPEDLENTPGYQFTLNQGLQSTNNALAAQGLGLSGAQAKGISNYTTGLANQTYGDQYNRALSTYNTNYQTAANNISNLRALVGMGQNAAAVTADMGQQGAQNAGNYYVQSGNAQASGTTGVGNAVSNGMNNYMLYNALYK